MVDNSVGEEPGRQLAGLLSSSDRVGGFSQFASIDNDRGAIPGGHTNEALTLLSTLDFNRYTPRTYIVSEGDMLSANKAKDLEIRKSGQSSPPVRSDRVIMQLPDSRFLRSFSIGC